ncbi:DUF4870 domain-containing protein [Spirillospora sp. CA-255316]
MTDQPPPHHSPYGQPPGAPPPPGYGQQPGQDQQDEYGYAKHPGGPGYGPGPGPGQGYDPRWGYGPPGVPYGPGQQVSSEDTTWGMMSYLGTIFVSFIAPLVIYFVKRRESAFVRFHAAQALNYMLTILIHLVAVLVVIVPPAILLDAPALLALLIPVYLIDGLGQWVFLILGAVKAGKGEYYRFPTFFCFRMVR